MNRMLRSHVWDAGPQCSVIVPAYQSGRYIMDCLRSVQAQTVQNIEILVIDDASTDGTAALVHELAVEDRRIRYIRQERNLGVAQARNRGIRQAQSDWIALLDSDDVWLPEKLERQFALQKESGAELLYTAAQCISNDGTLHKRVFNVPEETDYASLLRGNDIVCSSVLIKRTWLERFPMQEGPIHEDYLCWLQSLKAGCAARGIGQVLTHYRLTTGSKSRDKCKSAKMTWNTYKALELPLGERCICFWGYVLHSIKRYWE